MLTHKRAPKATKKGKVGKKPAPRAAPVPSDSDWTSGGKDEEVSVKSLLSNRTTMMASMMTRMDQMDGGPKRWKVAFQGDHPAPLMVTPEAVAGTPPGPPAPSISQERLETAPIGSLPPHLPDVSDAARARVA